MPRVIDCPDDAAHDLAGCLDTLGDGGFDPDDEDSLQSAARALRRLGNDRGFLGDMLIAQLKHRHSELGESSAYGAQSIVLSRPRGGCFLRANIWPGEQDACFRSSGAKTFVYGMPHDHNFSFLTVGYLGPGYASDYYEYDYGTVAGFAGERAGLRFVERGALSEGKLMLYRAHRDIHSQLPAESLSVSLNILRIHPAEGWFDQYGFDLDSGEISGVLNPTATETFLRCAVGLGGAEAIDLAEHFGRRHPSDRLRLASYEARALLLDDGAADNLWREAEGAGSRMVAKEAVRRRAALAMLQPAMPG
ncbi:MAG: transposase [Altererythrobacter sp.]|nr:transposase [Altererythrobacter sp.]